ncbi:thiol:disulfide interchange protein [Jeongeupia sp. HS-3]|uniref:thiol:disulfide interchange protein DsbA/DsbL n=1 Tax=Jeongeupia sp. HS-3 TaxID=1009682 RepID=UPI0018A47DB7|nr:thiol:disulfide interchange protein DsbA/DsbL [Jeongeupia sp. HS-3]BCL77003.1 thiol:disulfide interchange protein [Jeongeupia sp. HS-3]
MIKRWMTGITFALVAATAAHAEIREGTDYKRLATPQPVAQAGKAEVIEFFWYGCPHCYTVEPYVESWAAKLPKDVNFRRVHVMWPGRSDMEGHAKLFAALQQMGLEAKLQQAVFNAVQRDGIELRREADLYPWIQKQGVDLAKFKAAYNSFSASTELGKLANLTSTYKIDGVPTFIVNGKYVTSPGMIGREDGTITKVIDALIAKDKAAAKPAAKAKK